MRWAGGRADAAVRGCGGCGGPTWGRWAQRSSSQRRTAAGRAPCRAALGEQGVRSPIFFLQPALLPGAPLLPLWRPSSQLSTAALPSKGARLLGWRHRCVVGPRGALSIPLYLDGAGGRRLFPMLLQEAVAGVKTPKVSYGADGDFLQGPMPMVLAL
jgi:hypothetical protein